MDFKIFVAQSWGFAILIFVIMKNDNKRKQVWWAPALQMFTRLSVWVIGPVIMALIIGKYLDGYFHSTPWIFLGLTAFAFIISIFKIIVELSTHLKKIAEHEEKNKKDEKDN